MRIFCTVVFFLAASQLVYDYTWAKTSAEQANSPQPEIFVVVDISGSMADKIENAKGKLEECRSYTNGRFVRTYGFYAIGEKGKEGEFHWLSFDSIDELRIPEGCRLESTQSPLDKGLKEGLKKLRSFQQTGSAMLWFVTDEILDVFGTMNRPNPTEAENQRQKFRDILKEDDGFPWVLYYDFKSSPLGRDQGWVSDSGKPYRLYLMIHYEKTGISQPEHDAAVNKFLKFVDALSQKLNQKAVLFKYDYPDTDVKFDVRVDSARRTYHSGVLLNPFFDYVLSYTPKSYNLLEGYLSPAEEKEKLPLSVRGFEQTLALEDYEVNIPQGKNNVIRLENLTHGGNVPVTVDLNIKRALRAGWKEFMSLRNSGEVEGAVVLKLSEARFSPIPQEYPNIVLTQMRMTSNPKKAVTQGFNLEVKYPEWFVWVRWLCIFFLVVVVLIFLLWARAWKKPFPLEAKVSDIPNPFSFSLEPDGRKDLMIDEGPKDSDGVFGLLRSGAKKLGEVKRHGKASKFCFIPSSSIAKVGGEPPPKEVKNIKLDEPIKLSLRRDDGSEREITLTFRRQEAFKAAGGEVKTSTTSRYVPQP